MRFHTIHFPPIKTSSLGADKIPLGYQIENILVVKEGFCWPALLFTMLWAIWQRLWLVAAGFLSISLITIFILYRLGADQSVILIIFFGITSNQTNRSVSGSCHLECLGTKVHPQKPKDIYVFSGR